jgi:CRISPR system Cascade subunit CasD
MGRGDVRPTDREPTKSGVVGLLACALGWSGDEEIRGLARSIEMGVRVDREGLVIRDYHTVGAGYGGPMLREASGKFKLMEDGRPHAQPTVREYLCDASFLVAVMGPRDLIERLAAAIRNPHWPIYLGRKACPPTVPVYEGVGDYTSLEDALAAWPWMPLVEELERETVRVRAVVECGDTRRGERRRDVPVSRVYRTFGPRFVRTAFVDAPVGHQQGG